MKKIFYLIFIFLGLVYNQSQFKLKQSNNLKILNQSTKLFTGNVIMEKDTVIVYSDKTIIYDNENVDLYGNIRIYNGKNIKIKSQIGYFKKPENTFYFYKNTHYENLNIYTSSDTLVHDYSNNITILIGHAVVNNYADSTVASGRKITMENNDQFNIYGNAKYDLLKDSVTITSDTLIFDNQSNISYAIQNVKFKGNSFTAIAKNSKYYVKDSLIKFFGEPVIYYENNEVRGDSIFTYLSNSGLKKLEVYGSAYTINIIDSTEQKINKIYGREIYMDFANGKVSQIKSLFNAISIYHLVDDSTSNGINSVSSDSLIITFSNGKAQKTTIYGGVQGNYYPTGYKGIIKNDY